MSDPVAPHIVILSAPSGGGKNTIANAIVARRKDTAYSVSATTRRPRDGEVEGQHYYFLSDEEFERRRANGEMLESAVYSEYRYGTLKAEVEGVLAGGQHALIDIEVEGARQLRERQFNVVTIFVLPPSAESLVARLGGRRSDTPEQLVERMRRAIDELAEVAHYDYVVVNDDLEKCVGEVSSIIDGHAEAIRAVPNLEERLTALREGLRSYLEREAT
jgi:guanylate kinase